LLTYLDRTLSKKDKRKVARYMKEYNNMKAIIKSKELKLSPKLTSTIQESPVQESGNNTSEPEKLAILSSEVDELRNIRMRLDAAYHYAKPLHKLIWDECFIDDRMDADIYYGNDIPKRTYYREKNILMSVVAECLEIGTNMHHERTK